MGTSGTAWEQCSIAYHDEGHQYQGQYPVKLKCKKKKKGKVYLPCNSILYNLRPSKQTSLILKTMMMLMVIMMMKIIIIITITIVIIIIIITENNKVNWLL